MPHSDTSSFIQTTDNGNALRLAGDWTLANYSALRAQLTELPHAPERTASVAISAKTASVMPMREIQVITDTPPSLRRARK